MNLKKENKSKIKEMVRAWITDIEEDMPIIIKSLLQTALICIMVLLFVYLSAPILTHDNDSNKTKIENKTECLDSSCIEIYKSKECSIFKVILNPEYSYLYQRYLYFSDKPSCEAYKSFINENKKIIEDFKRIDQ